MLHIHKLTYRIAGRVLFEEATVGVPDGRRAGLVGRNGIGKSTLLRLVAGELQADGGTMAVRPGARIGLVAQTAPGGAQSVRDTVLAADGERLRLLRDAETATDPQRIAELHTRLVDIDAHTAPARAAAILAGLGFDEAAQARSCGSFSGGWRMRVALAAALFASPDLLLLDEPSNHLDLEATIWLESYLASYPGTLVIASHDRDLLNKAVTHIIHLDHGRLTAYTGGYDAFARVRRERLALQDAMRARQDAHRRHIQTFIDRFRAKATKARQAQSRIKALARMEPVAAVVEDATVAFDFPQPEALPPPLIDVSGASVRYGAGEPVLRHLNLRIDMDDRIALLGANGNGKSTLLRLLAGRLEPATGSIRRAPKLAVGYYAQDQFEQLDQNGSAIAHLARILPEATERALRTHLGRFGLSGEKAELPAGALSGGERARLVFALISRTAPHLMLLDEPTNHLDVDSREALVAAVNAYDGAVILVTHDRHLVDLCADRLWLVADRTCRPYDGDMEEYRRLLLAKPSGGKGEGGRQSKKDARRLAAAARVETAPLRRAAHEAEARLEALGRERAAIIASLADPTLYDGPAAEIARLGKRQAELDRAIAAAEEAWLTAQEALDSASSDQPDQE